MYESYVAREYNYCIPIVPYYYLVSLLPEKGQQLENVSFSGFR